MPLGTHSNVSVLSQVAGLLALAQLSQEPFFHRGQNVPQPLAVKHKGTAAYLKGDWRDEGAPVGRLGPLVQQGLDLWAETHKSREGGVWGAKGRQQPLGWSQREHRVRRAGSSLSDEGTEEKPGEAAGPPAYLIFNRGQ